MLVYLMFSTPKFYPTLPAEFTLPTVQPSQQNTEESDNLVDELIEDVIEGSFTSTGNDDWKGWRSALPMNRSDNASEPCEQRLLPAP